MLQRSYLLCRLAARSLVWSHSLQGHSFKCCAARDYSGRWILQRRCLLCTPAARSSSSFRSLSEHSFNCCATRQSWKMRLLLHSKSMSPITSRFEVLARRTSERGGFPSSIRGHALKAKDEYTQLLLQFSSRLSQCAGFSSLRPRNVIYTSSCDLPLSRASRSFSERRSLLEEHSRRFETSKRGHRGQLQLTRVLSHVNLCTLSSVRSSGHSGPRFFCPIRSLSSGTSGEVQRESIEYDVVIVGAGPAGLAAAIRLKQLCEEKNVDLSVCVVEKGAEVGAHILSGNVFETRALDELLPDWKEQAAPLRVPVTEDKFWLLSEKRAWPLPSPFNNDGNYVISLSELVRWLGAKAEEVGIEIYPGFAASELLYGDDGNRVTGIVTNDLGLAKDGSKKDNFQLGMELKGRLTLLGEGCRGSLSELVIEKFQLRKQSDAQHQTYALGIKEVWEVDKANHRPGSVLHTVGWPLDLKTYGGSFLYHMDNQQVAIGLVVALDYRNPYLSPYEEYQRFKHHPSIRPLLEGGKVVQYGARTLNEGGIQSIPKTVFPGGALIGCSAGFVNVPKIKGSHTAMKTGMLAAEAAFNSLTNESDQQPTMEQYWASLKGSWVWKELHQVRNIRPGFHHGLIAGITIAGMEHYVTKGILPYTLQHGKPDHASTEPAELHKPIMYPKPDGVISFDLNTSLYRSNTNHDHDQPPHLRLRDRLIPENVNLPKFAGPEARYCPARVYEYEPGERDKLELHINAQNCLHCKACDIKDPLQNIQWTVPEGGGGPSYSVM